MFTHADQLFMHEQLINRLSPRRHESVALFSI
ncbi:hypothetical protein AB7M23_003114 [Pseudomonas sp. HLS-6 TE3448]